MYPNTRDALKREEKNTRKDQGSLAVELECFWKRTSSGTQSRGTRTVKARQVSLIGREGILANDIAMQFREIRKPILGDWGSSGLLCS